MLARSALCREMTTSGVQAAGVMPSTRNSTGSGITLGEEEIVFAVRVDVVDTPSVAHHLDRLAEAGDRQCPGRRKRRVCAKETRNNRKKNDKNDRSTHGQDANMTATSTSCVWRNSRCAIISVRSVHSSLPSL